MSRRSLALIFLVLIAGPVTTTPSIAAPRTLPYWASLSAGAVMMRAGPGRNFPAEWLYQRRGLPVKVVQTYTEAHAEWRRIADPDGTQGWVQANLLSEQRTALIIGDVQPLREHADADARIVWRAEPGVVGKITHCARGWCAFDVEGRSGFVEVGHLFGVDAAEVLP